MRVWDGDLTDKNMAIQLLIIVDHKADWARDYYREMIKTGLQNLHRDPFSALKCIDSQKTDILSKVNTRTSDTKMDFSCRKLGTSENEIQCSASYSIPASIPGYQSYHSLSGYQPSLPLTGASSPSHPPPPINDNLYPPVGNPYLGVPQSAHQLQQFQSINGIFLPGSSPLPIAPQTAQQSQPPYVCHNFPSAGIQNFGASQAVQQWQPEIHPTTRWQLDLPGGERPIRKRRLEADGMTRSEQGVKRQKCDANPEG